jgi:hypothetical protein
MYIYTLIDVITNKLKLSRNIQSITIIDFLKLFEERYKLLEILKSYQDPTEEEKYIIDLFSSEELDEINYITQSFFRNFFSNIYMIIGNPYSIDSNTFDIIYDNKDMINKIPDILIKIYEKIMKSKNLYKYYNLYLIKKFYKNMDFISLKKDTYYKISKLTFEEKNIKWKKYEEIFEIHAKNCQKFKKYLEKVINFYTKFNHNIVGCYNVNRNIYPKLLESHVGFNINIDKLEKWAVIEINKLNNKMKYYIKKIKPSILDEKYAVSMLNKINKFQKFKSKQEYIDNHFKKMKKYNKIFEDTYNFKLFDKPNIVVYDNKNLGGAYYYENNFYLNTSNWKEKYKYTTESLVLHEVVPGHHLQVHTSKSIEPPNILLYGYFDDIVNGFIEGWGLFSEKLGINQTDWDKIGQIEYEMFRTLRIVADIGIHYRGNTPDEIYNYMKNYLSMGKNELMIEIYRYVCMPGQAVSYKVGSHIFSKILEKNKIKNYHEPKAIEIYKSIINSGPKPLKFLVKEYSIDENTLFDI